MRHCWEGYKAGERYTFSYDTHSEPSLLSVFSFGCISQLLSVEQLQDGNKTTSLKMTTPLFPLNLCSVTHWWGAFQSCSLPVLTSLPIIQAASQTSDANSTRLLCKRTLINHQLNQTIYCVISRQLVNTSQILLTAVTAFPSSHIPAFQYTTATVFLALSSPVRHGSG